MNNTVKLLLLSSVLLFGTGWFLYHLGSQFNLEAGLLDQALWDQAPGDKWLYVGGLMMLISGALGVSALKVWRGSRRPAGRSSLTGF